MKRLKRLAAGIESKFDRLFFALQKRLGSGRPLQIVTFRSYGTLNRLHIKGRVLKAKAIRKSTEVDTVWNNLLAMYKRFKTDEVRDAKLKVTFGAQELFVTTDHEGYFRLNLFTEDGLTWTDMWHAVEVELVEAPYGGWSGIQATAHVLVPPPDAEYGIISDIDDTVVKTTATSLLAMSRNTFFHNAHSRLPFAGVSEFYRSLQLGRNGKRNNPFFYVSSSPWNLYDLLIDFLDLNNIPEGPLLLRDFGLEVNQKRKGHMGHKFGEIKDILLTYPDLNFVLIGDSGQDDPRIYREVVSEFPGRILAIYIRDVQLSDREQVAVSISEELSAHKVEMIIVDNSIEAAEHAARTGLIFAEEIPKIVEDKKQDKGEVPGKEDLEKT